MTKFAQLSGIGFSIIAVLVLLVYYPSFLHVPRSDQVNYLAEVANRQGWVSLAIDTYDLNRHRLITPGDELLFRPVVYFILGTEKFLFGYNFMLWQMVGVALHLWAVWCLLRLLLCIQCHAFAVLWTAFFALLFINMEMVAWHHISSYMLFWGLILTALHQAYVYVNAQKQEQWRIWGIGVALLFAVFTYEIGNIYAVLIFLFLRQGSFKKDKTLYALLIPVIVYASTSTLNFVLHKVVAPEGQAILHAPTLWELIKNSVVANCWWLYSGLFPNSLDMMSIARNIVPQSSLLMRPVFLGDPAVILAMVLIGIYVWCVWRAGVNKADQHRINFIILLAMMLAVYTAAIVVGRGQSRIFRLILGGNLYYNYSFWVLASIVIYACIDFKSLGNKARIFMKFVLVPVLVVLMIINGFLLQRSLNEQALANNDIIVLVQTLDLLIKEKQSEKDFSFYVADDYPGNYVYNGLRKITDPIGKSYSFVEALYPSYYTTHQPKYRLLAKPTQ